MLASDSRTDHDSHRHFHGLRSARTATLRRARIHCSREGGERRAMTDFSRPHHEPALTIYAAFQTEAAKRKGRTFEEWIASERLAVWTAARDYAQQHGLAVPTMADVWRA